MTNATSIDFRWGMTEATADGFAPVLAELGIEVSREPFAGGDPDAPIHALLEEAGLHFDQQQTSDLAELANVELVGTASAELLGRAIFRFASDAQAGGVTVDLSKEPAQLTEVRGVTGQVVVVASREGTRQVLVDPTTIASALRRIAT